ncbi:MAG: diguanylate cyclase domain-containing protein [Aureliella sp.]
MNSNPTTTNAVSNEAPEQAAQTGATESTSNFPPIADKMAQSRLGIHASLFQALKAKNPPSAAHCLRVALACSKWAMWREMPEAERDHLEVAALLHDIGKIGVPDELLQKPGPLSEHERLLMDAQRTLADQLIATAGASDHLLQIVGAARLDYLQLKQQGIEEPAIGMLRIADAYDSMTNQQVFRRAMSRELALEELCKFAGQHFDPVLVRDFAILVSEPRQDLEQQIAQHWLGELDSEVAPGFDIGRQVDTKGEASGEAKGGQNADDARGPYHQRLLESLDDAVIYLDPSGVITTWNSKAEDLIGRQAPSVLHRMWDCELSGLYRVDGVELEPDECPIARVNASNATVREQYQLKSTAGREYQVQLRAIPLFASDNSRAGSIIVIRDASKQANLEQRVETLHAIATQDPLTKVANRAELTRRLREFVESHLAEGCLGSLIMCDIDFFKKINDTFGHQAGDEALVTFAGILSDKARDDDLVARYGGEEFVIICEACDNAAATIRAEQIRAAVQKTPVPSLDGRNMTSSFGVTELQPGDTPETIMARVDRALMMAKENGRNRVVQLGVGQTVRPAVHNSAPAAKKTTSWMGWFSSAGEPIAGSEYLASVPKEVAVQKLEGFINDHRAELVSIEEGKVVIRVEPNPDAMRSGERASAMILSVSITSVNVACGSGIRSDYQSRTKFAVTVCPYRARDRRSDSLLGQANQLLQSFQSYLVAEEIDDEMRTRIIEPR